MSTLTAALDNKRLSEVLEQEIKLFGKILSLCRNQAQLLDDDEIDELNASMIKGDKYRDEINTLHQELGTLMQSYSFDAAKSGVRDDGIDAAYNKLMDTIRKGAELNERNMNLLKIKSKEQTEKIDRQRAKREGITGYAQAVVSNPEMYDRTT